LEIQSKRWQVARALDEAQLARFPNLSPLIVQLLHNRRITEPSAVDDFLAGGSVGDNPFQMKGVDRAVTRLSLAIRTAERIAVYGDFDTDGVTATTLLAEALRSLGADVIAYIPDRVKEGYGLNLDALRYLYRQKVRIVVTVDCGIRAFDQVKQANKGLDMIITDHHTPDTDLPPALSVINPKQPGCPYPFKLLAGVGVAYKLAQGLLRRHQKMGSVLDITEDSFLDLVALGTVADLVPLVGENRAMVRQGMKALNQPKRPGIAALMANASLRRGDVDATAIGFRLGPRLNAAGRIDSAMLAYNLLASRDPLETKERAAERSSE
jgi:single-stranded-DNA-specific exonuclease